MTQPEPMTRADLLAEAARIVTVDRTATHGKPEDSFAAIARVWSALTGLDLTPCQVALMLAGLKMARAWQNPGHTDNFTDLAGYAACAWSAAQAEGAIPAPASEQDDTPPHRP